MENDKRLSEIDRKLGVEMRRCKKCNMEFHILRNQEYTICPFCAMEENK